jgi:diguanylate cyclase (GGDEF)-like protein
LGIFITEGEKYKGFINLNSLLNLSYQRNLQIVANQNPLTKLPGNNQIEKFISDTFENRHIEDGRHIIYFDFNDFKPFNDVCGFRQGDRAILIFSEILQKKYPKDSFIAHIGGDDFFVGLKKDNKKDIFELTLEIQNEFENSVKNLYSNEDKQRGYIVAKDRFGTTREFKLLSVSSAIVKVDSSSKIDNFDQVLSELKKESKSSKKPIYRVL